MKILRDHILKEFIGTFLSVLLTLIAVFMLGRGLVQMADMIFNKDADIFLVFKILFLSLPFIMIFAIPMATIVSCLLTFGKLSTDNEITTMKASGINMFKIVLPLLFLAALISLVSLLLADQVAAKAHYGYRVIATQIGLDSPAAAIEEGTFIKRFKNFVIFIYEVDKNKLKGVRIYQPQENKPTRTIVAQKGEIISDPDRNLVLLRLIQGTSDEPDPKDPGKFYKVTFKTYDLPLNTSDIKDTDEQLGKKPKDMTINELRNEIERLGEDGIKATYPLSAEIHNKYALALSGFVFMLIGIPLGITNRRSEKTVNFGIGLAIITVYWLLLIAGKALAQKGLASPLISLEFCNFVGAALGIFLLVRLERN